jgi:hypothetical protein
MKSKTSDLAGSTVWAIVVVVLGFLGFMAFLINAGRSEELQRMLLLVGQGFATLVNILIVYRSSLSTNKKVDTVNRRAEEINAVTEEIRENGNHITEILNGNTPQPGSIPSVNPGEGYKPEH